MWKVEIKKIHKLYEFTDDFIKDMFNWTLVNKGISLTDVQESIHIKRLYDFANECPSLKKHMYELAQCSDIEEVFKMYIELTGNYEAILKRKFEPTIILNEETTKTVRKAFEYFYNEALDLKSFWANYKSGEYKSKNDFRNEIGAVRHRCPYCDIQRTTVADFTNTDHFLPISNYPILGIMWKNLVVSCIACNTAIKNKVINLPILHPFFDSINDELFFTFIMETKTIEINAIDNGFGKKAAENFYKLFHLEKNYPKLWDVIEREEKDIIREASRYIKKQSEIEINKGYHEVIEIIDDRQKNIYSQRAIGECTKLKLDFYKFYKDYSKSKMKKFMLLEQYGKEVFKEQEV